MTTYTIGMLFVGWTIALLMILGFIFIKACESLANNPKSNDSIRMGADAIIQDYNSRNLGGRIALILYYAVKILTNNKT